MKFIEPGNIGIAFAITLALMIIHFISPYLLKLPFISEKGVTSFGGGLAVTYVFLYMLPELVEGDRAIGSILADDAMGNGEALLYMKNEMGLKISL